MSRFQVYYLPEGLYHGGSYSDQTPDVPEALVEGKEMMDLSWFYHNRAYNPAAITQADINEYVSHYSAPGAKK